MMSPLSRTGVSHLVFDIHGVLLGRTEPAGNLRPGPVLAHLRSAGYQIRFLTNSSSVSRSAMAAALEDAGIEAGADEVFTAATTLAHYLRHCETPKTLCTIGSEQLREELAHAGNGAIRQAGPDEADMIVVSRDPTLDQATLDRLARNSKVRLLATCRDSRFPNGERIDIGPGPTVERVEAALGRKAHVLGKPNPYALSAVMGITPATMRATLVIGDSREQDIALAANAGARSVLLAAGGDTAPGPRPDRVVQSIDSLLEFL